MCRMWVELRDVGLSEEDQTEKQVSHVPSQSGKPERVQQGLLEVRKGMKEGKWKKQVLSDQSMLCVWKDHSESHQYTQLMCVNKHFISFIRGIVISQCQEEREDRKN